MEASAAPAWKRNSKKVKLNEGLQVFGTDRGFNAVNGLLLDVPWMRVPLLFGGTGMLFAVLMLGSVLMVQLARALRPWPPDGGSRPLK